MRASRAANTAEQGFLQSMGLPLYGAELLDELELDELDDELLELLDELEVLLDDELLELPDEPLPPPRSFSDTPPKATPNAMASARMPAQMNAKPLPNISIPPCMVGCVGYALFYAGGCGFCAAGGKRRRGTPENGPQ